MGFETVLEIKRGPGNRQIVSLPFVAEKVKEAKPAFWSKKNLGEVALALIASYFDLIKTSLPTVDTDGKVQNGVRVEVISICRAQDYQKGIDGELPVFINAEGVEVKIGKALEGKGKDARMVIVATSEEGDDQTDWLQGDDCYIDSVAAAKILVEEGVVRYFALMEYGQRR